MTTYCFFQLVQIYNYFFKIYAFYFLIIYTSRRIKWNHFVTMCASYKVTLSLYVANGNARDRYINNR